MQAYEITTKIYSDGKIQLPEEILEKIQNNKTVRLIILFEDEPSQKSDEWSKLTQEQFLAGYDDADSIYDEI